MVRKKNICRRKQGTRSRKRPERLEHGSEMIEVGDDGKNLRRTPPVETTATVKKKSKRLEMRLQMILDVFGASSREPVEFNLLIQKGERYCNLDDRTNEHVVHVIINLIGKICRSFGKED